MTYYVPEFAENFEVIDVPFFFYDVNFDGKKELMLTEFGNGQRFVSSFKVFLLDNGELIDDYFQITNIEPFRSFDAFTKINNHTKEFILYLSSGARSSGFHTYELDDKGILKLVKIVQDELDENNRDKYFTNTYKVVNGEKVLVTREHKKI